MASDDSRDPIDDVQSSQYTLLGFIGKGGGGSVFKAHHKIDQQFYAIKQITSKTDDEWMRNCKEAKIQAKLYHKNIVRYQTSWRSTINIFLDSATSDDSSSPRKMDISSDVKNLWAGPRFGESSKGEGSPMEVDPQSDEAKSIKKAHLHLADVGQQVPMGQADVLVQPAQPRHDKRFLYIAMQYCPKNLIDVLEEKVEADLSNSEGHWTWVASIIRSVANAIGFIHKNGYFHRDLKPENILFDSKGVVKVGDFGLSKNICKPPPPEGVEEENHSQGVGTDAYLSPEQSEKKPYNHRVDIYQLGLIMFHMIKPESIKEKRLELADIKEGKIPDTRAPPRLKHLFSKMVSQDANERPDAKSVSSACSNFLEEFPKEFPKDKKKKIEKQ